MIPLIRDASPDRRPPDADIPTTLAPISPDKAPRYLKIEPKEEDTFQRSVIRARFVKEATRSYYDNCLKDLESSDENPEQYDAYFERAIAYKEQHHECKVAGRELNQKIASALENDIVKHPRNCPPKKP